MRGGRGEVITAGRACPAGVLQFSSRNVEQEITRLLVEWRQGHEDALAALLPLVYDEFRRIASRQMARERDGHTLQPTALVHEAWMQLANAAGLNLNDRAHFLAIAARSMRQILVQHARKTNADRRGAGVTCVELKDDLDVAALPAVTTATPSGSSSSIATPSLRTSSSRRLESPNCSTSTSPSSCRPITMPGSRPKP